MDTKELIRRAEDNQQAADSVCLLSKHYRLFIRRAAETKDMTKFKKTLQNCQFPIDLIVNWNEFRMFCAFLATDINPSMYNIIGTSIACFVQG